MEKACLAAAATAGPAVTSRWTISGENARWYVACDGTRFALLRDGPDAPDVDYVFDGLLAFEALAGGRATANVLQKTRRLAVKGPMSALGRFRPVFDEIPRAWARSV